MLDEIQSEGSQKLWDSGAALSASYVGASRDLLGVQLQKLFVLGPDVLDGDLKLDCCFVALIGEALSLFPALYADCLSVGLFFPLLALSGLE